MDNIVSFAKNHAVTGLVSGFSPSMISVCGDAFAPFGAFAPVIGGGAFFLVARACDAIANRIIYKQWILTPEKLDQSTKFQFFIKQVVSGAFTVLTGAVAAAIFASASGMVVFPYVVSVAILAALVWCTVKVVDIIIYGLKELYSQVQLWRLGGLITLDQINLLSTNYTDQGSMENAIKSLAADALNVHPSQLHIEKVVPSLTSGLSGSPVYLVFKNKQLSCVIKSLEGNNEPVEEINALRQMAFREISNCQFPKILGIGSYNNKILLAQSVAPGIALDKQLEMLGKLNGQERENKFKELKNSVKMVAKAFCRLHIKGSKKRPSISQKDLKNSILNKIGESKINPILANKLEQKFKKIEFINRQSYVHGDMHPGNIFIDKAKVTLIDNHRLYLSMDQKGEPMGLGTMDIGKFLLALPVIGYLSNLTKQERNDLSNTFLDEYVHLRVGEKNSQQLLSEVNFMKAYYCFDYLQLFQNALINKNNPFASQGREKIGKAILYLNGILEKICD